MEQLTDKQLELGYWLLTHRHYFKKALVVFLILINTLAWGFGFYQSILYFSGRSAEKEVARLLVKDYVEYESYRLKNQPMGVEIGPAFAVNSYSGKKSIKEFDLVSTVKNLDFKWAGKSLQYHFVVDGVGLPVKTSFILPSEEKYLTDFSVNLRNVPKTIQLVVDKIEWQRIRDWKNFSSLDLLISEADYDYYDIGSGQKGTKLVFTADNQSIYDFWEMGFHGILYRGNQIIGVGFVSLDKLLRHEPREVQINWWGKIDGITRLVINPDVNLLNPDTIMELEGGVGEIK